MAGRPQRTLLGLLAVRPGELLSTDQLAEWTWGSALPGNPRGAIHTRASRLRRSLGDAGELIVSHGDGYILDLDPAAIDLHRFVETVTDQDDTPRMVERAVSLWRGEPFADAERLGVFDAEIERLNRFRISGYLVLIRSCRQSGDVRSAFEWCDEALRAEPFDERVMQAYLDAAIAAGEREQALRRFERWRSDLRELSGREPDKQTTALASRLVGRPAAASRGGLGRRRLDALARASLIGEQRIRLISGEQPALIVRGVAGAGKSMVAAHWLAARERRGDETHVVSFGQPGGAFDRLAPTAAGDDPSAYHMQRTDRIVESLQRAADECPQAVLLDDLHLAFDADLRTAAELVVAADGNLRVFGTTQPRRTLDRLERFLSTVRWSPHGAIVDLAPLTIDEVSTLVDQRLGRWSEADRRAVAEHVYAVTSGHAFTADALLRRLSGAGPPDQTRGGLDDRLQRLATDDTDAVSHLIDELDEGALRLLHIVSASLTPLGSAEVASMAAAPERGSIAASDDLQAIVDQMLALGLVRVDSGRHLDVGHQLITDHLIARSRPGTVDDELRRLAIEKLANSARRRGLTSDALWYDIELADPSSDGLLSALSAETALLESTGNYPMIVSLGRAAIDRLNVHVGDDPQRDAETWMRTARACEYLGDRDEAGRFSDLALEHAMSAGSCELVAEAGIGSGVLGRPGLTGPDADRLRRASVFVGTHGSEVDRAVVFHEELARLWSAGVGVTLDDAQRMRQLVADAAPDVRFFGAVAEFWSTSERPAAEFGERRLALVAEAYELAVAGGRVDQILMAETLIVGTEMTSGVNGRRSASFERFIGRSHLTKRPRHLWFSACFEATYAQLCRDETAWNTALDRMSMYGRRFALVDSTVLVLLHRVSAPINNFTPIEGVGDALAEVNFGDLERHPIVLAGMAYLLPICDDSLLMIEQAVDQLELEPRRPLHRAALALAGHAALRVDAAPLAKRLQPLVDEYRGETMLASVGLCALGEAADLADALGALSDG